MAGQDKFMHDCFLCGRSVQYGPHLYEAKFIAAWGIVVCPTCHSANWDGIVPGNYAKLDEHLKSIGATVSLNAKGWIDWPGVNDENRQGVQASLPVVSDSATRRSRRPRR